jgi:hypothetical protein
VGNLNINQMAIASFHSASCTQKITILLMKEVYYEFAKDAQLVHS